MCGTYGLGGGTYIEGETLGLDPLDTRESRVLLEEWMREHGGKANTTRAPKDGHTNLNPVIHAPDGERVLELAWWWHHVAGQPAPYTAFNSRDDALMSKWRQGFQHRALLPADWYSEGGKRWTLPSGELFAIAAILSPRTTGITDLAYSMVTRAGIGEASTVVTARGDSRMPLVIPRELHDAWLDPERPGDEGLVKRVQDASTEISLAMTTGAASLF